MPFEIFQSLFMFGASGAIGAKLWVSHSAHVSNFEWLNPEMTKAKVTIYVWYKPWVKKMAIVENPKGLTFTWHFCDEHGNITDVELPGEICGYLVKQRTKANRKARLAVLKELEKGKDRYWTTSDKLRLPEARVVKDK